MIIGVIIVAGLIYVIYTLAGKIVELEKQIDELKKDK